MTDTYIENLKIGGGKGAAACGNSPAGGCTIANDGDISTDGTAQIDDTLTLGEVGNAGEAVLTGSTSGTAVITTDATASKVTANKPIAATTSVQINGSTSGTATLAVDATTTKATLDKPLEVTGGVTASTALTGATLEVGGGYGSTGATISSAGAISTNSTIQADGIVSLGIEGAAGQIRLKGSDVGAAYANFAANTSGGTVTLNRTLSVTGGVTASTALTGATLEIGGGYGSTGLSVAADGALSTNGTVSIGLAGTTRGVLTLLRGASTNTPGYVAFTDSGGTARNFWASTTGGLRVHTSAPAANTDGVPVSWSGSEIVFCTLSGTPASLTLTNQSTWYPLVQFTSGDSVSVGSDTTTTVTGGPPATAAYITAVTAGTYFVSLQGSLANDGTNQEIHVGVGIGGSAPTGKLIGGHTKLAVAGTPAFFNHSVLVTLAAGDVLRPNFYNHTSAGKVLSFEACTLRAQRIA